MHVFLLYLIRLITRDLYNVVCSVRPYTLYKIIKISFHMGKHKVHKINNFADVQESKNMANAAVTVCYL